MQKRRIVNAPATFLVWACGLYLFLMLPRPADAALKFWDGSSNGNWSTAANWADNIAPIAGDDLIFPAGVTRLLVTNNFSPPRVFATVTFQGSNYMVFGTNVVVSAGISSQNPTGTNTFNTTVAITAPQTFQCVGTPARLDFNGAIDIGAHTLTVTCGTGTIEMSGNISGTGDLTKLGTAELLFNGAVVNTYSGTTRVNAGTLTLAKAVPNGAIHGDLVIGDGFGGGLSDIVRLGSTSQIAGDTAITIASSGLFDLNDINETTGSLGGSGRVDLGTAILNVGGNDTSTTYSGLIIGTGNFTKTGTGTMTLTANNTYTGNTTASGGVLIVDGSQPQSAAVVNSAAKLGGDGVVGNASVDGDISPGASPAVLTTSNLTFGATGDFYVELGGTSPGSGYDQLNVRGSVQLGSSTLHVDLLPPFAPAEGDTFVIVNNDGADAVGGIFTGLANGAIVHATGGLPLRIFYGGAGHNDVLLVVTNLAAKVAADPIVQTGNGNGAIEPGECNLLRIILMNTTASVVSGISAVLSSDHPAVTVTQPASTYPDLPGNGMRTNDMVFQLSTSPLLACGTNIDLVLTVSTATNGSFQLPITVFVGAAGPGTRINNNIDLAIPDVGTVDSTVNVAGFVGAVARVVVSLHITHTAVGDLSLSLVSPSGTIIDLSSGNGGTGNDYGSGETDGTRTTFSELGATAITSASAPFVGTFRPEQSLGVLRGIAGLDVNGTWRLRMTDSAGGTLGTLRAWSLVLSSTVCAPGGGECLQCGGPIAGVIGVGDAVQTDRLTSNGIASNCDSNKTCVGTAGVGIIRYDTYTFTNVGPAACVTVDLQASCGVSGQAFSVAYLGAYDPANKCANYLGDLGQGLAAAAGSYSFVVPGESTFVVLVSETTIGGGCTNYTMNVTGFCCPVSLAIDRLPPSNVLITWPTSAPTWRLIATPTLDGPPNPFAPAGPTPVVINSRYAVTNATTGSARYYELVKP